MSTQKGTLHPIVNGVQDNTTDLYPKTSAEQVEGFLDKTADLIQGSTLLEAGLNAAGTKVDVHFDLTDASAGQIPMVNSAVTGMQWGTIDVSNKPNYVEAYSLTITLANATASASNSAYAFVGASYTFTAASGYKFTNASLSGLTGATGTWTISTTTTTDDTAVLTLTAVTDAVSFTVTGIEDVVYPTKGQLITMDLDGTSRQFRVLKISGSVAECVSMYNVNDSVAFASSGQTYANGTLDTYLNTTWYGTLSATAKAALVDKTFTQDSWDYGTSGSPVYQGKSSGDTAYQVSLGSTAYGSSITRHVYALSVQDVIDYLGVTTEMITADTTLTYNNIWTMFWNDTSAHSGVYLWLRSADASYSYYAWDVYGNGGYVNRSNVYYAYAARAAFQIDLSKISWS